MKEPRKKDVKVNEPEVCGGSPVWEQESWKDKEVEDRPVPITNNGLKDKYETYTMDLLSENVKKTRAMRWKIKTKRIED